MIQKIYAALSLLFCFSFASCQNSVKEYKLSVDQFEQKLNSITDAQLVDVRSPEEYSEGHLKGSLNMDWNGDNFEKQVQSLDKNKPVLVYCLSGGRSASAATNMRKSGFKEVFEMKDGIRKWKESNKPIVAK